MKLFKNKKGNVEDVVTTMVWIFSIILVILISGIILTNFNTVIQAKSGISTESQNFVSKFVLRWYGSWDLAIVFLLFGFLIFSIMAAKFIPTDPIYMGISLIAIVIILLGAVVFANVYDEMTLRNVTFASEESNYTFIPFIMDHILEIAIIYFGIITYVLFSRKGSDT